jgi:hypothetical protein
MTEQMFQAKPWRPCRIAGCRGVRVDPYSACWADLDAEDLKRALSVLKPGTSIDVRGTQLTPKLLADILAAMRHGSGPSELGDALFDGAWFAGDARFDGVRFGGNARFDRTLFSRDARFDGARFAGDAHFDWARFGGDADFMGAQFTGDTWFYRAQFKKDAGFIGAQFTGDTWFYRAQFRRHAKFGGARLRGNARFDRAQFIAETEFRNARFNGNARFNRVRFCQRASFRGVHFLSDARFMGTQFDEDFRLEEAYLEAERVLGPILVENRLALDETTLARHLLVEAFTSQFTCIGTEFRQGATIRLRGADVVLDHCIFGRPTTISFAALPFRARRGGLTPELGLGKVLFVQKEKAHKQMGQSKPRLLSMRGVDVSSLTLVELDLSRCIFQGAHRRDELRIVGARPFADTPNDSSQLFRRLKLWRHWTHRQTLAEEHRWRRASRCPGRWYPPECRSPPWLAQVTGQTVDRLNPDRLASIYRALRKAQEDNKNQPGAADFYYGEMEMRRLARSTPRAERCILKLYWLISGYSLRGLRTLLALLIALAAATVLIAAIGFPPDPKPKTTFTATIVGTPSRQSVQVEPQPAATVTSGESLGARLGTAAVIALEATAFRAPAQELNYKGRTIHNLLRIVGPVLLALTLLSVRNRVKR